MAIHLGVDLRRRSSSLPEDGVGVPLPAFRRASFYLALLRVGFGPPPRHHGRPGALTARFHPYLCSLTPKRRGHRRYVSVPLSIAPLSRTMRLGVTQHPAHGARTFLPGCKKQPARPSGPRPCSPLATIRTRDVEGKSAASHPVILSAPPVIPANAGICNQECNYPRDATSPHSGESRNPSPLSFRAQRGI